MIDLKRNTKKELVPATGARVRKSYLSTQSIEDFKISRGKFSDFLTCKNVFTWIALSDLKHWNAWLDTNETTDLLLKKNLMRVVSWQKPHRLFRENGLEHFVPFEHPDMDKWRDSLRHGLMCAAKTNIILTEVLTIFGKIQ